MSSLSTRSFANDAASLLGERPIVTMFDRGEPAACLTVCLVRRGAGFVGRVGHGALLVDRVRLGLRPAFFCQVDGQELEGELQVRVHDQAGSALGPDVKEASRDAASDGGVVIDVVVDRAAPAVADAHSRSIPRT